MEPVRDTELLQAILQERNRKTERFGDLDAPDARALGYNPVCGDRYEVFVRFNADSIQYIRFKGFGCVISRASASLMAETLEGLPADLALERIDVTRKVFAGNTRLPSWAHPDMEAFLGVRQFPRRMKCVTLAWHAARAALVGEEQVSIG